MGRIVGKVALITGAARGLGEAGARLFAAEGATVILADVDETAGRKVAEDIGAAATFARLDVCNEAAWAALIADIMKQQGRLDILVNNAGVVEIGTPESVTEADYRKIMAVSVDGVVFGCKHAIAAMKQGGGGSIINMASIAAIRGQPYVAAYSAAKGAVAAYTRSVAVYCAQAGLPIRANAIQPAGMDTDMVRDFPDKFAKSGVALVNQLGQGGVTETLGTAEDIARLALFLASDESGYISGQCITVDDTISATMGTVPARPR